MVSSILGILTSKFGIGLAAIIVGYIFKKIPNEKFKPLMFNIGKKLGALCTLFATKWAKGFWNQYIEPWFIDAIENVVGGLVDGFIAGLKTDNK